MKRSVGKINLLIVFILMLIPFAVHGLQGGVDVITIDASFQAAVEGIVRQQWYAIAMIAGGALIGVSFGFLVLRFLLLRTWAGSYFGLFFMRYPLPLLMGLILAAAGGYVGSTQLLGELHKHLDSRIITSTQVQACCADEITLGRGLESLSSTSLDRLEDLCCQIKGKVVLTEQQEANIFNLFPVVIYVVGSALILWLLELFIILWMGNWKLFYKPKKDA